MGCSTAGLVNVSVIGDHLEDKELRDEGEEVSLRYKRGDRDE